MLIKFSVDLDLNASHPHKDETGRRYGRLRVVEFIGRDSGLMPYWLCRCDCGEMTSVMIYNLKNGRQKSCGCLRREATGARFKKLRTNAA